MEQLRAARSLGLPDWCIAAGFVRNRVWDRLHGIAPPRPPVDIDVLYFDASDLSKEREAEHEGQLHALLPDAPWQVRNQARMHVWKNLPPHRDTADAMTYWLETVTAVGVRLEADDRLTVVAPLGTDDLLGLRCRPTAFGRTRRDEYEARIAAKRWRELWPKVRFVD
ncbi:MAG: nucleotidyltransferase family protein [Alphaproteobacteria bacterium]|nr:nucleotidyltransferase family protein [Alphaproteobacteria bacterium]MBV8410177.1 nucleotidyltransferase family protein [Alphaproteobacteria bacterium]